MPRTPLRSSRETVTRSWLAGRIHISSSWRTCGSEWSASPSRSSFFRIGGSDAAPPGPLLHRDIHRRVPDQNPRHGRAAGMTDKPMTLRELLETLKCYGGKLALHDGDTITIEPPDVLTPALRAALTEHHAALVALIRSGPSSTSAFDTLLMGLDGLGARPPAEVLHERLQALADGLGAVDPLVRELVRTEAIAR